MDVHENGETSNGQTETNTAKRQVIYYHCIPIIFYHDSVYKE